MTLAQLTRAQRLITIIAISFCFFVTEIAVGFSTHSLALVADAFHYLNDLIGFIVALVALKISQQPYSPNSLSFGWQRSQLLGAFFNGVFLLALGVSILLQAIERFIALQRVENPKLVLIVGCIGFTLNVISAFFLHEHEDLRPDQHPGPDDVQLQGLNEATTTHENHRHVNTLIPTAKGHDLGVMGVLTHVIGDAINNIGVIVAALVIWLAKYDGRFYADPGVSAGIALLILASAVPLVKNSGSILLESVPLGVNLDDIQHDLETVPGVTSIHELHVWRLNQNKAIASAHVVTTNASLASFMTQAQCISECLHAYGIHSVTLQPEITSPGAGGGEGGSGEGASTEAHSPNSQASLRLRHGSNNNPACRIVCGTGCEPLTCCG